MQSLQDSLEPHMWDDTAAFINTPQWGPGKHVIAVDNESAVEVKFRISIVSPETKYATLVILKSHVSRLSQATPNFLDQLSDENGLSHISIRGKMGSRELESIVAEVRRRIHGELVFVGIEENSSDAINLAYLHQNCSALVINPRRTSCENNLSFAVHDMITKNSIDNGPPRRIFGLYDTSLPGSISGVAEYLEDESYVHRGNGLYSNSLFHSFVFSNLNNHDEEASAQLIIFLLKSMSDPAFSPRRIYVEGLEAGHIRQEFVSLPLDLRQPWDSRKISAEVSMESIDNTTSLVARIKDRPIGYGGTKVEITFYRQQQEIHSRREVSGTKVHLDQRADYAKVTFRDGFDYVLGTVTTGETVSSERANPSIFILGSCVSRDAFDLKIAPVFVDYRARSALGSAFAPVSPILDSIDLNLNPSAFQRRMVETDLKKQLASILSETEFDYLLFDLIDERLQLFRNAGSYITYSPELQTCGFKPSPDELVEVGSEEYHRAFTRGLEDLLLVVPPAKIIVNEVYWARTSVDGDLVGNQALTSKHNLVLCKLYRELRRIPGIHFITYPEGSFISDPEHKWGVSPFHYKHTLYEHTLVELKNIVNK